MHESDYNHDEKDKSKLRIIKLYESTENNANPINDLLL